MDAGDDSSKPALVDSTLDKRLQVCIVKGSVCAHDQEVSTKLTFLCILMSSACSYLQRNIPNTHLRS